MRASWRIMKTLRLGMARKVSIDRSLASITLVVTVSEAHEILDFSSLVLLNFP